MEARADAFLASLADYPAGRYEGRGVIIAGGGARFFPSVYVSVRALRHAGCHLPIQVWYLGRKREMPARNQAILAPYGVECVDGDRIRRRYPARRLGGWELKVFATLHSPFEELLLLDADCYPCRNPEFLFERDDYRTLGAIFWPDLPTFDGRLKWPAFRVAGPQRPGSVESGQFVLNKELCWRPLNLAWFYNDHSDYYYHYGFGDKHTLEVAWTRCGQPFVMWEPKAHCQDVGYLHRGPDHLPLFVHRCCDKFRFAKSKYTTRQRNALPSYYSSLPLERECWGWMADLAKLMGRTLPQDAATKSFRPAAAPEGSTRFTIATLYTPESAERGKAASREIRAYARRHGYEAIIGTQRVDCSRPAGWSKLLFIDRYLSQHPDCEWLLWIDPDLCITDPAQRLENLLIKGLDFVAAGDLRTNTVALNVFLVHNKPAVLEMLRRAYEKVKYTHHPHGEMLSFIDAMRDCTDTVRAGVVPPHVFTAFGGGRLAWPAARVSDACDLEAAAVRNYWEHRLLREAMTLAAARRPIRVAYDLGAGYGRMARVLAEFAQEVIVFERDPHLLARGRALNPDLVFIPIKNLTSIPAKDASTDFVMTFTVLQYLTDATCHKVLGEMKRLAQGGHILLVESTDENRPNPDLPHDETGMIRSRARAYYESELSPWHLVRTWPRRIEPLGSDPQPVVGTAMLFAC